jgi:HD-GYP domain-containing protein (c-di-GMP phosphodiesterase class II)
MFNKLNIFSSEKHLYHDVIDSIVTALDAKDPYTCNHSKRVGDMTYNLCTYLGMKGREREVIHIAAHVHDIGKIGIPDNILNKNSKLTAEEWEYMKRHPQIGFDILNKSRHLKDISKIVLHHHERWDGKGYPSGLTKSDIPLGSRIIAICDSIDAMMSKRAYRNTISIEECKAEIQKNINIMYDPMIAECMLHNWNHILI